MRRTKIVISKALCIGYLRATLSYKLGGEVALAIEDRALSLS